MYPELLDKIQNLTKTRDFPPKVMDVLLSGINHPEIGAALAEKWNFPPALINAIRYHHSVDSAPAEYRTLAATVCLADLMIHYNAGEIEFYQIETRLLEQFKITSEPQLKKICATFQKGFESEQRR